MKIALVALIMGVNSFRLTRPHERSYINFADGVDEDEVDEMGRSFVIENEELMNKLVPERKEPAKSPR